jgi:hypothetical protein
VLIIGGTACAVALLLGGYLFSGCPSPVPSAPPGQSAYSSPDRERIALVAVEMRADVVRTFRVTVRPHSDWVYGRALPEREPIWTATSVRPLYVFWLDDDSVEVVVLEADRPAFASIRQQSVDGIDVVTRASPSTEARLVLSSELLSVVPSGAPR